MAETVRSELPNLWRSMNEPRACGHLYQICAQTKGRFKKQPCYARSPTDVSERGRHVTSDFVQVFGAECGRGMSAAYVPQNRINLPPPATIYEFTVMSRGDLVAHPFADELSLRRQFSTVIAGKGKLKCWDIWQSQ